MERLDLVYARLHAGLTVDQACALTGRHRTTWRRMERGETRVDRACLVLLELLAGELGVLDATWSGWRISRFDGLLYSPALRDGFRPADVHRLPWLLQLVRLEANDEEPGTDALGPVACGVRERHRDSG